MGSPPPLDAPSPDVQDAAGVDAGFSKGPPAAELCGFALPSLNFHFGFRLPGLGFPPPLPSPFLALGLSCDANNPIDISGGVKWGGGRVGQADPRDPEEEAA
jgi:hypothetical protein